jgi:hypothetical protein
MTVTKFVSALELETRRLSREGMRRMSQSQFDIAVRLALDEGILTPDEIRDAVNISIAAHANRPSLDEERAQREKARKAEERQRRKERQSNGA